MSIFYAIMRTAVCNGKIYASDYLKLCHILPIQVSDSMCICNNNECAHNLCLELEH